MMTSVVSDSLAFLCALVKITNIGLSKLFHLPAISTERNPEFQNGILSNEQKPEDLSRVIRL